MATKRDKKLLFKAILPESLKIKLSKAEEGGYWAKVADIPCYAQGENLEELFNILTEAVYVFYSVPTKLIPELGTYLPVNSVRESVQEQKPPSDAKYTLDDILQKPENIRELQRVSA